MKRLAVCALALTVLYTGTAAAQVAALHTCPALRPQHPGAETWTDSAWRWWDYFKGKWPRRDPPMVVAGPAGGA